MKEIKAFIRASKAEEVIQALEAMNVCDITLIDVMGIGTHLSDPDQAKYSVQLVNKYSQIAKIEIVCKNDSAHNIVEAIRRTAYSGTHGDGMIYVMPVEMAVKIRTGSVGDDAL